MILLPYELFHSSRLWQPVNHAGSVKIASPFVLCVHVHRSHQKSSTIYGVIGTGIARFLTGASDKEDNSLEGGAGVEHYD